MLTRGCQNGPVGKLFITSSKKAEFDHEVNFVSFFVYGSSFWHVCVSLCLGILCHLGNDLPPTGDDDPLVVFNLIIVTCLAVAVLLLLIVVLIVLHLNVFPQLNIPVSPGSIEAIKAEITK